MAGICNSTLPFKLAKGLMRNSQKRWDLNREKWLAGQEGEAYSSGTPDLFIMLKAKINFSDYQ